MTLAAMIIGSVLGLAIVGGLDKIRDELKRANDIADTHLGLYAAAYKSVMTEAPAAPDSPEVRPDSNGYL